MTQIELGQPVNIIGHLQINEWNNNQTPQMIIQDLATQNEQILDYRSKRKQLNIDTSSNNVAFVIHSKKKLGEIISTTVKQLIHHIIRLCFVIYQLI